MKKIKRTKAAIVLILIIVIVLTGCSSEDRTGNGSASVSGNRTNGSDDGAGTTGAKKAEEYGILVLNQKGEVLSGADVTLNGVTKQTGDSGFAMFEKPKKSSASLVVSYSGYYTVANPVLTISKKSSQSRVILKASSISGHRLSSAYYVQGNVKKDLLQDCKLIYKNNRYTDFSITASVINDSDRVYKYELHQQIGTTDKVIATSTNGTFEHLNHNQFDEGTGVFVVVYDKSNHRTPTSLNFEVGKEPDINTNTSISLGEGIEFEVSDRVPIFGGTKLKMNVPELPITQSQGVSDDGEPYVRVGFNVSEDTLNNMTKMEEYKKCVDAMRHAKHAGSNFKAMAKSLKRHQKRAGIMSMSKFEKGIDFSATGYVEAGYDSTGKLSKGTGYLCVTVEGSAEFDWQFVVWVIPVNVNVKGEITADLASTICYSFADNSFEGSDVALTIKPGLTVSAGPGFKYLSAGVYGNASLEAKLVIASITEKSGLDYVDMHSSIGIYGKFGPFEAEKNMWESGTINLYKRYDKDKYKTKSKSQTKTESNNDFRQKLYDITNYQPIEQADSSLLETAMESDNDLNRSILAHDINEGAKPVMEANNNTALAMFPIQEDLGNADYTYSKMYYSIYEDGQWSDSISLDSNVCNQMNPVMYRNGNDVYIAYQETDYDYSEFNDYTDKTSEEKMELMKAFWRSVDLHIQKFNLKTKTFTDMGTIRTADSYDYNASMGMSDGDLCVYWVRNQDGDVFGMDEAVRNDICRTYYANGSWESINTIQSDVKNVTNLEVGQYNGAEACVYTTDEDENMSTWDDMGTYIYCNDKVQKIRTEKVSQLQYKKIPSDDEAKFLISDRGGLFAYSNGKWETILENTGSYNDSFSITDNAIYFEKQTDDGSELYGCYRMSDASLAAPIQISEEGNWLRDVSVFNVKGKEVMLGMEDMLEDGSKVQTNLVSYQIGKYYDLSLEEAFIDYEDTFRSDSMPVYVVVKNTGNMTIPGEEFTVKDGNNVNIEIENKDYSKPIKPGESVTLELSLLINENTSFEKWEVESSIAEPSVASSEEEDGEEQRFIFEERSTQNNMYTIKTGYSDFIVNSTLNNAGGYPYLMVEVKNNGTIKEGTTLKIYDANDTAKELYSENTSDIEVGSTKVFKINVDEEWGDSNGKAAMLIKALETDNEIYTYNNFRYEYATLSYGRYAITYVLNGGKNNRSNPASYLTTDTIELEKPEKSGYTFAGWYTTSQFESGTQLVQIDAGTAGNMTLYAKWSENTTSKKDVTKKKSAKKKPGRVRIKSAKNIKKRKISLSWKKVKNAKGYKLQYSISKKFSKKKTKTKYCKKTKYTIKKRKKKKTYYIRVRAYKLNGKKKVYGPWSKVKKVKIKR